MMLDVQTPAHGASPRRSRIGTGISQHSRDHLRHHVDHICHMLSEQGPMSITFVHNNTLLGLQKNHFEAAIDTAKAFLGGRGYLENSEYRDYYGKGRITNRDLDYVMGRRKNLDLDRLLTTVSGRAIQSGTVMKLHLVHGINAKPISELRFSAKEAKATRQLRRDLPSDTRAGLLKANLAQLERDRQRVGVDRTLGGWLQDHLNLQILAHVIGEAMRGLAEGRDEAQAPAALMSELEIPADKRDGYLKLVTAHLGNVPADQRDRVTRLWLRSELRTVGRVSRLYFDAAGTFGAVSGYFRANAEEYAALGLWSASLRKFGAVDPFSLIDATSLQERDPWSNVAEKLAERFNYMEQWGGPSVGLTSDLRAEIAKLVTDQLAKLEGQKSTDSAVIGRAQLCWIVMHDLGELHLNRRGFEALQALLSLDGTEDNDHILARVAEGDPREAMRAYASKSLDDHIQSLSAGRSHADFLAALTGDTIVERVNEYMIGLCSAFLDEGLASWHLPGRALGFYDSWRNLVHHDRTFDFDGLSGWRDSVQDLPILPIDAVITQLQGLGIPEENWPDYCGRLLVDLKGWAGMVFWRQGHPNYSKQQAHPIDVMQYLAVRLFVQNLLVHQACRKHWQQHPRIENLEQYFSAHLPEYLVRTLLYAGRLPDYLAVQARTLAFESGSTGRTETDRWDKLADMAWAHLDSEQTVGVIGTQCWRLFELAQFLGMDAEAIGALSQDDVQALLGCVDEFPEERHGPVWLNAFERHYWDEVLNSLALNRGRGRWMKRTRRPKTQVVFCIDEREESIHRHYEELDPEHETLGAAGFFGVAMDYSGLDEHKLTPLCPAVVTPAHKVLEVARPVDEHIKLPARKRANKWFEVFHDTYWEMKRNVTGSYFLIDMAGFATAYPLLGRIFFPVKYFAGNRAMRSMLVPSVQTKLAVSREDNTNPVGFTLVEQADRCEGILRNIGLISNFAPIVVFCAHGSNSQNNPHENAHDCGACGGKHGAPNSRAVAAMCNLPAVREVLRQRGIIIPTDTWFVGAVHNTASDLVTFFDEEDVPQNLQSAFAAMVRDLHEASMRAARERCRRFASAPKDASLKASFHHVTHRAYDFSQVRPEWGHATNAVAVVGRRGITQGVFLDRRPFIISYDPSTDPTGAIAERIIMAVGPVGAGINLEYYFSTVDTKVYGSDTKVPHNVTGLVGIMEGAHSDLRTGLPRQMTEIHEAMRLLLIIDAPMAILGEIYGRQPAVQELLNGEWVILVAHDPEKGEFNQFVPGVGFEKWDDSNLQPIPEVPDSYAWFKGKYEKFLPPAMIAEPTKSWKA